VSLAGEEEEGYGGKGRESERGVNAGKGLGTWI
jgi:hypothetical protein